MPAVWNPPSIAASPRAHVASLKSSGTPVADNPRNEVIVTTCRMRLFVSKRDTYRGRWSGYFRRSRHDRLNQSALCSAKKPKQPGISTQ
jgi:hypothetical protein